MAILKRFCSGYIRTGGKQKSVSVCSKAVVIQTTNLYVNTAITTNVPGVSDCVLEELVLWICLLRRAALRKKHICTYMQTVSSSAIFNHINGIHATAIDVTKGLIGLC